MNITEKISEAQSKINQRSNSTKHIIAQTNVVTYKNRYINKLHERLKPLTSNFSTIEKEYLDFNHTFLDTVPHDDLQQSSLWKYFAIKLGRNFPYIYTGKKKVLCKDFFPETYAMLMDALGEDLVQLGISCLLPGCTLAPHTGFNNDMPHNALLRSHLTLETPSVNYEELGMAIYENDPNRTGTPVTEPTRKLTWVKGDLFIFDDTCMHEVWNKTDKRRVVLMFDTYVDSLVNKHINITSPYTLQPVSMRQYFYDFEDMIYNDFVKLREDD